MSGITVSPAYGRDYKSARAARKAWQDGKDFIVESVGKWTGRPVSYVQLPDGMIITIRYNGNRRCTVVRNTVN